MTVGGDVACWGGNSFGQIGDGTTTARTSPVVLPSFTFNVDPTVVLEGRDSETTVTVLAICDAGHWLHLEVTLTQGDVTGLGVGGGDCTGAPERYTLTVRANGSERAYTEGPALAEASAHIRGPAGFAEEQEWTRRVTIVRRAF